MAVWHGGRGASRLAARRCRPSNPIPPDLSPRRPLTIEAMEEVSDLAEFMRQAVSLLADDDPSDNAVLSHPTTFLNEAPCRDFVASEINNCALLQEGIVSILKGKGCTG
ncbi:hypothetical protein BDA96_01G335900 [Sorghum bicolor]|uniref:Uncharacterized protein n=2 Tax=Sorghum bicolor TaxID=4558 RepID=A0A921S1T0_SORBI|nr:hypothetical protein BDA96_01G335900 [Sorghum bicolor]